MVIDSNDGDDDGEVTARGLSILDFYLFFITIIILVVVVVSREEGERKEGGFSACRDYRKIFPKF